MFIFVKLLFYFLFFFSKNFHQIVRLERKKEFFKFMIYENSEKGFEENFFKKKLILLPLGKLII